eukprot:UN08572
MIPLIIVVVYFMKIIIHRMKWFSYKADDKKINAAKMLERMPKSFKDVMTARDMAEQFEDLEDLEDYDANDDKTNINTKLNGKGKDSDDEPQELATVNYKVPTTEMMQVGNDSTELTTAIDGSEMRPQEEIKDEDENVLENELDVVMSRPTESIDGDGPPPPMWNPNAVVPKREGHNEI